MPAPLRTLVVCSSFLAAGLLAAGCETNPVTGRKQVMIVSEDQAQQASLQAYAKTVTQARSQRKLDTNSARSARVQQITNRLVAQAVRIVPDSADWKTIGTRACVAPAPFDIRNTAPPQNAWE